jgi:hypothetical protein
MSNTEIYFDESGDIQRRLRLVCDGNKWIVVSDETLELDESVIEECLKSVN